eukprot:s1032_g10.t1
MARAVPSGRDLRKYARLFLRTDHDSDGFISADEAKAVFNKSYLPPDVLINIFNQANVSQSPYLTFPEFIAAMHLIREARQTQPPQFPSISAELMNFLSNFYESPWDLAIQGSSKSAQALKQSAQSQGAPHQSFSQSDPTYQTQADSGLGQEKNGMDSAVPPTPDFPSAGKFEATKPEAEFSNDMAFADSDFGFGHADKTEKAEKIEKGKRKKEKKEKKPKEENKEMTTEPGFGAEWTTFGQDPGLGAETHAEIRESWPSFGNENEMSFGLEDDKDKPKQKRRQKDHKDQKDSQKDSEKGQNNAWSDDFQPQATQATRESFVPHFGDSTDRPTWDLSLPQPRTRFGLPVSLHGERGREQEQQEQRDPDYVARLEEILGVSKVHAGEAVRLDKQNSQWAGRRHDGHFEERYRTAFMDLGYGSPGVYVSLMGLKSNSHTMHAIPRVLPEPAKPFLKTVAPNFAPNFQAGVPGRSKPAFDLLRMR